MFDNKTVLITGSTSGIGYAIAQAFARSGCANVIVNGIQPLFEVNHLIEDLKSIAKGNILYEQVDLMDADAIACMMERLSASYGGIDILVNNAGMQYVSALDQFPIEKWDQILALNLTSAFHLMRLGLPFMRQKGWGRVINIASAHGLVASVDKSAYVAAKHGLVGLTKVAALETAGKGITVNAICPGWVLTPLVQKQIDQKASVKNISVEEATKDLLFEKQPSMAFVKPEDIGEMALFLCSNGAAQITGSSLSIDGGWTAR